MFFHRRKKRLTQPNENRRNFSISEFIANDVFGLRTKSPLLFDLMRPLTSTDGNSRSQRLATSLFDAIVSCDAGRNYFNSNPLMQTLVNGILGEKFVDQQIVDDIISAESKLSFSDFHRDDAINNGNFFHAQRKKIFNLT